MMQLNYEYQRDDLLKFLQDDFLPGFTKDIRPVNTTSLTSIKKANYLGESKDLDIQVFEFLFEGSAKKRVSLTKDAFSVMRSSAIFKALAVFRSADNKDWRFSLLTATPESTEKGKVSLSYSNPKRLSFFLGPDAKINTPTKFLINKGKVVDFDDLKSRFSIEVVNKEFYKEISHAYTELISGLLKLPSTQDSSQTNQEFAVRLIGRIIFCWFLREKKSQAGLALMPKELLSLEAVEKNKDYYHQILEPIFFEVLNKRIQTRIEDYIKGSFSSVPYLNGGLFSPQEDDFYKRTNGDLQSQYHNTLVIPDSWFKDFFQILETYNFTIDENTSFDEELSIDPEMLGRIFENLLAEINPETGDSERKSTGSYYTPRTIVNYMVDESLLSYLIEKTGVNEEKLRAIISYDLNDDVENPITDDEKELVINALEKIRILDPACGSGAFPIGALQKIVFILQQTDPDGQSWFKKQIENTPPDIKRIIEREFEHKNFDYIRKLGIIRENIYGVDIQSIATEISRLRCFLTLIVDERIQDEADNRGIEPLPNLDFKFVTANSLFGLPTLEDNDLQQGLMFDDRENIDKLKNIRDQYFNSSGIDREQLKLQFSEQQKVLIKEMYKEHGFAGMVKSELTQKLTDWEPFTHKTTAWFDPEWMFGIKNGFDLVIANPPYDVYQGEKKNDIEIIKKLDIYSLAKGGKLNSYKLFLARSSQLQKNSGILCEIFQNSFLGDNSAKLIREYFLNNQKIIQIDSFPERDNHNTRVFEAVKMSVCILLACKKTALNYEFKLNVWKTKYMNSGFFVNYFVDEIKKYDPTSFQIPLLEEKEKSLFSKLYQFPKAPIRCTEGELNMTFHKKYFTNINKDPKIIKGAAVQRFRLTDRLSQGDVEYLDEASYLRDFGTSAKSQDHKLARLAMQGITGVDDKRRLIMAYVQPGYYCANSCNYILSRNDSYKLNYLLGLYNSKLLNWIFKKTSTNSNVNCYEIENLPIPEIDEQNRQIVSKIEQIVKILISENTDDIIGKKNSEYEERIDQLVYKLYQLKDKEISLIENLYEE